MLNILKLIYQSDFTNNKAYKKETQKFDSNRKTSHCPYYSKQIPIKESKLETEPNHLWLEKKKKVDEVDSALLNLNYQFLSMHHESAQLIKPNIDSIMIFKGDELTLWKKNFDSYQKLESIIPTSDERYTRLKQMAHIAVLMTTIADDYIGNRISSKEIASKCKKIIPYLNAIIPEIKNIFDDSDIAVQTTLVEKTVELIEIITSGDFSRMDLIKYKNEYVGSIKNAVEYNNKTATKIQLMYLNKIISTWLKEHGIQLEKNRVILVSAHGPRAGRVEAQYFTRLYQEKLGLLEKDIEDNKVYHLEMLPSQFAQIDVLKDLINDFLLGSELNKAIGENILDSSKAMFSDILGQHCAPILDELFLRKNEEYPAETLQLQRKML